MGLVKIKKKYETTVIAFGSSGLPLGKRDDLDALAIIAHESNDQKLKDLFEELPSLADLKKAKVEKELQHFRSKQ